ncbi:MAG: hypothetical protein M1511_04945 [Deltaproteobacteria bacterium]|nr:hypothetical protein [Deltaproteobacteria bacterium]
MNETLFGHLVTRFSCSPENMATESLVFLFNQSKVAQASFCKYLSTLTTPLPRTIKFETQSYGDEDASIPDLMGKDATGQPVIFGEAKFWAGLTDNQPVTYLQRLEKIDGSMLVFLSPARRFPTLWPELIRRCNYAEFHIEVQEENAGNKVARVNGNQYLLLVSWSSVLDAIRQSLEVENERDTLGNLLQLQGLCDQMDTSAFLPMQSEELTSTIATRLLEYCDIIDEVIDGMASRHIISLKGLRATPVREGYKRYFLYKKWGCSLDFNAYWWKKHRETPLWLGITSAKWTYDAETKQKLVSLEMEVPTRLFTEGSTLYVPIFIETRVEKDEVLSNILEQITAILDLLST